MMIPFLLLAFLSASSAANSPLYVDELEELVLSRDRRFLDVVDQEWTSKEKSDHPAYRVEGGRRRFFVIGDIGGIPLLDVTSTQKAVARAMADRSDGVKSVINLGDNFYFTGVLSDSDPRFNTTFEHIYKDTAVPWLTIAGNHDHFGRVSAQILYTSKSKLWYFPALYYNKKYQAGDVSVEFIMLDTIVLCGNTVDVQNGGLWDYVKGKIKHKWNKGKMEPKNPAMAEKQWMWLEEKLRKSNDKLDFRTILTRYSNPSDFSMRADYLFVAGHYPVYSVSSHGPTECLVDRLAPLLKKYNATAYFSGHDHSLQHLQSDGVTYIVSGAGSRTDQSTKHKDRLRARGVTTYWHYPPFSLLNVLSQLGVNDGGFVELDVKKNIATVLYLNKKGEIKYRHNLYPRWMVIPSLGRSIDEDF